MAVHFVTGKLGGGKTLVSVGRIQDYLLAGKRVATNLDLNLEKLLPTGFAKSCEVFRIPDKPTGQDLFSIGRGTSSKKDEDFGLVVLDELGTWLNSRSYQKDKNRQEVIDWFLHARKYGWDVILIVQDPELIDKQVRISLGEHVCVCRRTDRIPIPIISTLIKLLTGWKPKLPRIHVGSVFYGSPSGGIKVDTWMYRGTHLFNCYDTNQVFLDSPNRLAQYLPPSYLRCIPIASRTMAFYMRLTKIYFKRFRVPLVFLAGLSLNVLFLVGYSLFFMNGDSDLTPAQEKEQEIARSAEVVPVPLKETHFVLLSYVERTTRNGLDSIMFFHDGNMFDSESSPFPISWRGGRPFAELEVVKEVKKSLF